MSKRELDTAILSLMQEMAVAGLSEISSNQLHERLGSSKASLNRYLRKLANSGQLHIIGRGKTTRYRMSSPAGVANPPPPDHPAGTSLTKTPADTATYRRSIKKYSVIIEAMGMPDPFRARYREVLGDAVRQVVESGRNIEQAMQQLPIAPDDQPAFATMLALDLRSLDVFNCARYRLSLFKTEEWVKRGRPV